MKFSVVIPTFNRAGELGPTLESLSPAQRTSAPWEVIVADNNSTRRHAGGRRSGAAGFPVELRYVFEREQGRSAALNAGIRAAAAARSSSRRTTMCESVPTGSTVRPKRWRRCDCDYVGGRVLPLWGAPRPAWIPDHGGRQWAVIALLDYGDEPIPFFTLAHRVPLGVNMAFRRDAFDRAGLWDNERRAQEGHAPRTGSPRVDDARARRRAARLVRAGRWPSGT